MSEQHDSLKGHCLTIILYIKRTYIFIFIATKIKTEMKMYAQC